jgi:prepilin-type N-terminal cleavage/methylation domain-containing protein
MSAARAMGGGTPEVTARGFESEAMTMMSTKARPGQAGFSLIELMVAMVVTLIVSGAIYGLLASGGGAFRREPELTERQQNIRVAMDLIQKDIAMAGMALPPFMQVFTRTDTTGKDMDAYGPLTGPYSGELTDELEVFGNDGTCPTQSVCNDQGVNVFTVQSIPGCFVFPSLVLLYDEGCPPCTDDNGNPDPTCNACYSFGFAKQPGHGGGSGACGAQDHVNFPHGAAPTWNPPGGKRPVTAMGQIGVFRWWVEADAQGVPNLWRSTVGKDAATTAWLAANGGNTAPQLVARGIEDLQVRYTMADGTEDDLPAVRDVASDATTVTQVRVTLTSRSEAFNLAGESQPTAGARQALRGQLTSVTVPRTALHNLQISGGAARLWQ